MDRKSTLANNITVLQRKLLGLKDSLGKFELSNGQTRFIQIYLETIDDYIEKGLSIMDEEKYKEVLIDLED
jgi:hypothetical protein